MGLKWTGKGNILTWPFGKEKEEEAGPPKVLPKWNPTNNRWEDPQGNEVWDMIETPGGGREDPYYRKTQNILFPYGTDILQGKLPDFYSSLGKTGTPEFENMLALINRDTALSVNENLVRRNISRGGTGLSTIAKSTADVGTKLRWSDFLRAQGEKQWLMGTGLETVGGVRSAALSQTGIANQWSLSNRQLDMQQAQIDAQAKADENAMWSKIISSVIGAGAILATGGAATPAVAASSILGSAAPQKSVAQQLSWVV